MVWFVTFVEIGNHAVMAGTHSSTRPTSAEYLELTCCVCWVITWNLIYILLLLYILLHINVNLYKMKWIESSFRPPLCTYRLNWARRTSWGWWDDWDDTVLQTQDSKFDLSHVDGEETFFASIKPPRPRTKRLTLAWKAAVLTTTLGPPPFNIYAEILLYKPWRPKGFFQFEIIIDV